MYTATNTNNNNPVYIQPVVELQRCLRRANQAELNRQLKRNVFVRALSNRVWAINGKLSCNVTRDILFRSKCVFTFMACNSTFLYFRISTLSHGGHQFYFQNYSTVTQQHIGLGLLSFVVVYQSPQESVSHSARCLSEFPLLVMCFKYSLRQRWINIETSRDIAAQFSFEDEGAYIASAHGGVQSDFEAEMMRLWKCHSATRALTCQQKTKTIWRTEKLAASPIATKNKIMLVMLL